MPGLPRGYFTPMPETDPTDTPDIPGCGDDDLLAAIRHMEDLDVFVGQRSRMHPGPGWALALALIRTNLDGLRAERRRRGTAA